MKALVSSKLNQALFFLVIAFVCTLFASCNDKDSCQKCAEERAAREAEMNETTTAISTDTTNMVKQQVTTTTNATPQKPSPSTINQASASKDEEDENVSVINPNDKSNSDSKRTYGSSGTGGGSGTSGSGGDGNGSSGWNDDAKNKN